MVDILSIYEELLSRKKKHTQLRCTKPVEMCLHAHIGNINKIHIQARYLQAKQASRFNLN